VIRGGEHDVAVCTGCRGRGTHAGRRECRRRRGARVLALSSRSRLPPCRVQPCAQRASISQSRARALLITARLITSSQHVIRLGK
jgi:hypothetical protein